ncbi:hypothetical protein [Xaviernesmea oryzae]|uniref:hypothetical protein n=1 Tax=Xaviernesmea oryzae TaxID=464029 RepID=UPI0008D34316|nr:hypothetical protein [Xaviernesmea oryzae]SEK26026.1 Acylphosphatase [Xaviernesmea oryzae]
MTAQARFTFHGKLRCESFQAFARHRARRLDIALSLGACDVNSAIMAVEGQPDLVDAFEMALSLGPQDCLVTDVHRETTAWRPTS